MAASTPEWNAPPATPPLTATDASHGYRLVTTYLTDPARDTVVMRTRLEALPGSRTAISKLHLYARLDAHVNGDGGGGTGTGQNAGGNTGVIDTSTGSPVPVVHSTSTASQAANRTYAVPTYMALRPDGPATAGSVGYAGTASDGLTQLDSARALQLRVRTGRPHHGDRGRDAPQR